jgi:hypothetical protein
MPEPLGILPELDPIKMQVALLFATDLLEEAGKVDMDSANQWVKVVTLLLSAY